MKTDTVARLARLTTTSTELPREWELRRGERWGILGRDGSGKSDFLSLFSALPSKVNHSSIQDKPFSARQNPWLKEFAFRCETLRCAEISFTEQQWLIDREFRRDDSDITDQVFQGTPVRELLAEVCSYTGDIQGVVDSLNLQGLLHKGFRKLSSGETRKTIIARALLYKPEILLLDEPYEGLDKASREVAQHLITELALNCTVIYTLNEPEKIPGFTTDIMHIEPYRIAGSYSANDSEARQKLYSLFSAPAKTNLPALPEKYVRSESQANLSTLVAMRNVAIKYVDDYLLENINWTIHKGEHWQLKGSNGSGKTTLLNLITGDHPQCYSNDIIVLGYQRGQGESIWDIKRDIGFVTSALQWNYRVPGSALGVAVSGLHDSIGIYHTVSDSEKRTAMAWLELLGIAEKANTAFKQLSHGEQRLVLIGRAMIKHPKLLLLDEPCQGLDNENRQRVLAVIEKLIQHSDTTLVYVTHHEEDTIPQITNILNL